MKARALKQLINIRIHTQLAEVHLK